jgi:hypothetical protein
MYKMNVLNRARVTAACRVAADSCRAAKRINPNFDFPTCVNNRKNSIRIEFANANPNERDDIINNYDWALVPQPVQVAPVVPNPGYGGVRNRRKTNRRKTNRRNRYSRKNR